MEIYGFLEVSSIESIGESMTGYQPIVVDYFNQCVIKYNEHTKVELQTKYTTKINLKDAAEDSIPLPSMDKESFEDVDFHGMTFFEVCVC
jgi:hypothetical protein